MAARQPLILGEEVLTNEKTDDEQWDLIWREALRWTMAHHRLRLPDAEEMVQEALRQLFAAKGVVAPVDPESLQKELGSRINGVVANWRRKKSRRAVELTETGELTEPLISENAEQRALEIDEARNDLSRLLDSIQNDDLAFDFVTKMAEGIEDPSEMAKVIGVDVRKIYNAKRRIIAAKERLEVLDGNDGQDR